MNKWIVGTAILVLGISALALIQISERLRVDKNGVVVKMKILRIPNCTLIGRQRTYNIELNFQGKDFESKTTSSLCKNYNAGDSLTVRYMEGSDVVLLPEDNPERSCKVVLLAGVVSLIILLFEYLRYRRHILS